MSGRRVLTTLVAFVVIGVLAVLGSGALGPSTGPVAPASPGDVEPVARLAIPNPSNDTAIETAATDTSPDRADVASATARSRADWLRGRVLSGADDRPVLGAAVRVLRDDRDAYPPTEPHPPATLDTLAEATTDHAGSFAFEVGASRPYRVEARAAGFAPAIVTGIFAGAAVDIRLFRGAVVEGTVTLADAPLPDVPVVIVSRGAALELGATRTAQDGSFRITGLAPTAVSVEVRSPTHVPTARHLVLVDGETHRLRIDVPAGQTIVGMVRDATTGVPIGDAEVSDVATFARVTRSVATGAFALHGVPTDQFVRIHARAAGYADGEHDLSPGEAVPITLMLARGATVTGRIVDEHHRPLPGATVVVGAPYLAGPGMPTTATRTATLDQEARFVVDGLRADLHYSVFVRHRDFGTRVRRLPRRLAAGEALDLGTITLRHGSTIEGRVVDEHGEPVRGAEVRLEGADSGVDAWLEVQSRDLRVSPFEARTAWTSAAGHFGFADVAVGQFELTARHSGRTDLSRRTVAVAAPDTRRTVTLVVARGPSIRGVIRRADGQPFALDVGHTVVVAGSANFHFVRATPDATGHFELVGLADDAYDVGLAEAPAGRCVTVRRRVPTGTDDLELVLGTAATIRGRVVDASGAVRFAMVSANAIDSPVSGTMLRNTATDGTFELDVPPDFHGSLHAMDPEDWRWTGIARDVRAGSDAVEIVLNAR